LYNKNKEQTLNISRILLIESKILLKMDRIDLDHEKKKITTYLTYYKNQITPKLLSKREYETVLKKLDGGKLTPTEKVYLSRSVKKKLEAAKIVTWLCLQDLLTKTPKNIDPQALDYLNKLDPPFIDKDHKENTAEAGFESKPALAQDLLIIIDEIKPVFDKVFTLLKKLYKNFNVVTLNPIDATYNTYCLFKNNKLNKEKVVEAKALARGAETVLLFGKVGNLDYVRKLIRGVAAHVIEVSPKVTRISTSIRGSLREDAEEILPVLYNNVLEKRIKQIIEKKQPPEEIISMYLYGSVAKKNKIPNDIDMLVVFKDYKKKTLTEINKVLKPVQTYMSWVQKEIGKLTNIELEHRIQPKEETRAEMNNVIKAIINHGVRLHGDTIHEILEK